MFLNFQFKGADFDFHKFTEIYKIDFKDFFSSTIHCYLAIVVATRLFSGPMR